MRSLCEFTAKCGDLDRRFTPSTSAQEGVAGHRLLATRRDKDYRREVSLQGNYRELHVRGRADGYDASHNRLEEFKTYRGDLGRMADNQRALHWAQLETYGAMLCRQNSLATIELSLVYFEVNSEQETPLRVAYSSAVLQQKFVARCARFLTWAQREIQHRTVRDVFLNALSFPYASLRTGQRALAEAVFKTVGRQTTLMAQAPTGIGKTIGTLFPLIKAMPRKRIDKVFFLVAKTSGRASALEAMRLLVGESASDLRVLEYSSRESACEYPGRACNAQSCPLAKGFYDLLPDARLLALKKTFWDQTAIRVTALRARVCPYYLMQELARWSDVIIADYNYYFDARASLFGLTNENQWRVVLLIDEAHNLLPRAREMYSVALDPSALQAAQKAAPASLKAILSGVAREWARIPVQAAAGYNVLNEIPRGLLSAVSRATKEILDHFANDPAALGGKLQEFFFAMLHFSRLAEAFDTHSVLDALAKDQLPLLSIRNVVPARFLAPRFQASTAAVLFSATLAPADYYRELLGLPKTTPWLDVETPFRSEQLSVRIARHISTRYVDRPASVAPIVDLIVSQYRMRPGNYLAFFSSFEYLRQVSGSFTKRHSDIPTWEQAPRMDALARERFLTRFSLTSRGIGFSVLGGVFGEGIDLPGNRLIGAFIATLGLPQINSVNAEFAKRMQDHYGAGYEFTYLYPGLQKVVQAAGRVIRTLTDNGTVHLIDDRFAQASVRALLPTWWQPAVME